MNKAMNKGMMVMPTVSNPMEGSGPDSMFRRAERLYEKQKQLHIKLLEVNRALLGSEFDFPIAGELPCILDYLNETESTLNLTLELAEHILLIVK